MKPYLAMLAWIIVCLSVVVLMSHATSSCRSSVPVVVKQINYQCSTVVDNGDGTVNLVQCREDGHVNQEAGPGGSGDDTLFDPDLGSQAPHRKNEGTTSPRLLESGSSRYQTTPDPRLN